MPESDAHYDIYTDFEFLESPNVAIAGWQHLPAGPYWVLGSKNGVYRFYKRGHLSTAIDTFCREFLPLRNDIVCFIKDSTGDVVLGAIYESRHLERGFAEWYGCQLAFDELERSTLVDQTAVVYWRMLAQGTFDDE